MVSPSIRARRQGFTLIELLVVVAIIALLIAILLPSLSNARRVSYRTTCAANMSGVAKAMNTYAAEWDTRFPPSYRVWFNFPTSGQPRHMYYREGQWDVRRVMGAHFPAGKLWMCPAPGPTVAPYQLIDQLGQSNVHWWQGTNYTLIMAEKGTWVDAGVVKRASWDAAPGFTSPNYYTGAIKNTDNQRLVLLTDVLYVNLPTSSDVPGAGYGRANHLLGAGTAIAGKTGSLGNTGSKPGTPVESFSFRDTEIYSVVAGANVAYMDAHVEFLKPRDLVPIQDVARISYLDIPDALGYYLP